MTKNKIFALTFSCCMLMACTGMPDGVTPVKNFEVERYLGNWYEIARLDHSFERGLIKVTAHYAAREDGGIDVINRGFNKLDNAYKEANGKAYFIKDKHVGRLKVSFFGPFYGGYNVIALDEENYNWVLVSGPSRNYLWILARERKLAPEIVDKLVSIASDYGFPTDELIFVEQRDNQD